MNALPSCMPAHQLYAVPSGPEEGVRSPVTDDCELLYRCWELNSGPLKEKSVL